MFRKISKKEKYNELLKKIPLDKAHELYSDRYEHLTGANYFSYEDEIPKGYLLSKIAVIGLSFLLFLFSRIDGLEYNLSVVSYMTAFFILLFPVVSLTVRGFLKGFIFTDAFCVVCAAFALLIKNEAKGAYPLLLPAVFLISDMVNFRFYRATQGNIPHVFKYGINISSVRFFKRSLKNAISKGDTAHFSANEVCPAGAVITKGEAVCLFSHGKIQELPLILKCGDKLVSGTKIVAGEIDVEFVTDGTESFLYKMKNGTLKGIAESSASQKKALYVSQALHFGMALFCCLSLFGLISPSDVLVASVTLCLLDVPFQCAFNVISTYFIKNLYDRGVYITDRDKISLTKKTELVLIPEALLLKSLQSKDVSVKIDEAHVKNREELVLLLWVMTKNAESPFFAPLKAYFSFNEIQLFENNENILNSVSEISYDGEYEISCVYKGDMYILKKNVRDNINDTNAFDIALHTVIQILKNEKHVGYILYDYAGSDFMNSGMFIESEKRQFSILTEDFKRFENVYTKLIKDRYSMYYNAEIAEISDPDAYEQDLNDKTSLTVLTDAAKYPHLMDAVHIAFVDKSPELLIYVSKKYAKYRYLSGMLVFLYLFLSVIAFSGALLTHNKYFLLVAVILKTFMICAFSFFAKLRIDTKKTKSAE